jgi:DNA-binding MarR family transcriptional regulator
VAVRPQRPTAAEQSLGMLIKRAEQAMLRSKNGLLKPTGITLAQYVALVELDRQPGITAATLSRACLVSPQAIMILLKSMEQQGLVSRSEHPRHPNVLELHITDAGREALHAAKQRIEPTDKRVLDAFSARDQKTFRDLLSRFIQTFETE